MEKYVQSNNFLINNIEKKPLFNLYDKTNLGIKNNHKIILLSKNYILKYLLFISFSFNIFLLIYFFQNRKIMKTKNSIKEIKILSRDEALDSGLPFIKKCLDGKLTKKIKLKERILNPKITAVIPCYNCFKYIKRAVRSIQNQDMDDIQIIIQNDNSNKKTLNLLDKLKKEDSRIEVYNNKKNMNLFYTRSIGVLKARGKYVVTLDADDLFFDSDVFDTLYEAAEDGNFDIISYRIFEGYSFSNREKISDHLFNYKKHNLKIYQPELSCYTLKGKGNDLNIWGKLYTTSVYKSSVNVLGKERISQPLMWDEDISMLITIMNLASSYKYIRKYGLFHNIHSGSFSTRVDQNTKIFSSLIKLDIQLDFSKRECSNFPAILLIRDKNYFIVANDARSRYYLKKIIKKILFSDKIDINNKNKIRNIYINYLPNNSFVNEF